MINLVRLCLFFALSPSFVFAELTDVSDYPATDTNFQCTKDQRNKNIEIIRYCNSKWTDWGVIPKPKRDELRSVDECYDSSKDYWLNVYNNCPEGLLALPIMIGQLTIYGMAMAHQPDKESARYILMNGSKNEVAAHYTNEIIRRYCDGLSTDRDFGLLKEKLCPHRKIVSEGCSKEKQRIWEQKISTARQCKRNFRKTWRSSPSLKAEVESRTKKVMEERAERERIKREHNEKITSIKNQCQPIINPYKNSILKYILPGVSHAQDLKNFTFPNRQAMLRYNSCIKKYTNGDKELVHSLMKGTGSILQSLYGDFYDATKCFEPEKRMRLYCELVGGVAGAGLTTVGAFVLKKSARRQTEKAMLDFDLDAFQNKFNRDYASLLPKRLRKNSDIQELISSLEKSGVSKQKIQQVLRRKGGSCR